jgi:response regulator RpfG family c-di-GMP phosphodiesterase
MVHKILCVDDDENILSAYQRQLRKQFQLETALGGNAGLARISAGEQFAVVVSDLRMPEMDGIEFLSRVRQVAPDAVRIMLSGNADLQAAIEAVNQGNIFRFLTKPCSNELLAQTLEAALQQYRLITAERELLEQTLKGSVSVLTEILSILDASSFGRACTLKDLVRDIAMTLKVTDTWDIELAAMLCEIGRITIPANTLAKEKSGASLSEPEMEMLARIPEIGHQLLSKIPRLESVAQIVQYQKKNFDGSGQPQNDISGKQIPLGARILHIASALHHHETAGSSRADALIILASQQGIYDITILDCASNCLLESTHVILPVKKIVRNISVSELEIGQMLLSNVTNTSGTLLIPAGNKISESLRERIRNFHRLQNIKEPITVEMVANP